MPYLAHFGLKDHPFTLTPNIDYYYPTQENANIIASLDFALRRDSGIMKIVGEVGTGKTLLCRMLINKLVDTDSVAYINAPQADAQSILRTICGEFGIELGSPDGSPYAALNRFLVEEHANGRLAVVVVDEAQHLGKEGLEAVRLISNLETERRKLLQIVLFGQTELDELLRDPGLRQLNQRVAFSFNTGPLTPGEAKRYITHRLRVSRQQGVEYEIFADAALSAIAEASGGIPRVINILADKSLLVAFSDGSPIVQRAHALEAIRDTSGLVSPRRFRWHLADRLRRPAVKMAAAAALLLLVAGLGGWIAGQHFHGSAPVASSVPAAPPAATPEPRPAQTSVAAPSEVAPATAAPATAASAAEPPAAAVQPPVQPAPVQPAPVEPAPAEPAPVEPALGAATPAAAEPQPPPQAQPELPSSSASPPAPSSGSVVPANDPGGGGH